MAVEPRVARCRTCGAAYAARARFDNDEGVHLPPSPYCSIHCEHYAGLARSRGRASSEA